MNDAREIRVTHRFAPFALFALAVSCSDEPDSLELPDASAPMDASVSPDAEVTPQPCDARAETITLSEGGRAAVTLALDQADAVVSVAGVPEDWRVDLASDRPVLQIRVPYGIQGRYEISLALTCGADTGRGSIAVDVRPIVARDISAPNGPDAREHALLWVDGDSLFLFGGFSFSPRQFTVVSDVWAFDLIAGAWSEVAAVGDIPLDAGGRLATVPGSREVVLFGGSDQQNVVSGDVSAFDPMSSTFTTVSSAAANGTLLGAFIYDAPRDRYLSVCGYGDAISCDVHAYDRASKSWTELDVSGSGSEEAPAGRYGFFYAHDTEEQRLIIFSGAQNPRPGNSVNPAADTWALELAEDPPRWVQIAGVDGTPPGRRNGCTAYDPVGHRMFVFGGTPDARTTEEGLWALSLDRGAESWSRVEVEGLMPARSSGSGVYDPGRARVLFGFGNSSTAIYDDLWALEL